MKVKIGIFLEPDEIVTQLIKSNKETFLNSKYNAKYLTHPVHLTVYVINIYRSQVDNLESIFNNISIPFDELNSYHNGWNFFLKDPFTGWNTVFLEIVKNTKLSTIQNITIEKLNKFSIKLENEINTEVFEENTRKFGYPFVNDHWHPHISIGSIDLDKRKILEKLGDIKIENNIVNFTKLTLYLIKNNNHIKIAEKQLRNDN